MRQTNDTTVGILLPAIAGLGCVIISLLAINAIVAMTNAAPRVGDIVSFNSPAEQPLDDSVRMIVRRQDRFGCVLDLGVLRRSGGSLIVEGQTADAAESFRVHWAGERTTADTANCGDNADLILERRELDILALGAGGYGAGQKRLPPLVNESGV